MNEEHSKFEETALIRAHYKEAMAAAGKAYYQSEEIAAYLTLEIFRLENLQTSSEAEEKEKMDRLSEKTGIFSRTKETMYFILDKLHKLGVDRDKFISDIYTSNRIVDLESQISNLTPWLEDLLTEVQSRAETAKLNAKIMSELSDNTKDR